MAEREIDSIFDGPFRFGNLMFPFMLRIPSHNQQATVPKFKLDCVAWAAELGWNDVGLRIRLR